jgi:hypothetical protein
VFDPFAGHGDAQVSDRAMDVLGALIGSHGTSWSCGDEQGFKGGLQTPPDVGGK